VDYISEEELRMIYNDTKDIKAIPPKIGAIKCFCDNEETDISKNLTMNPQKAWSMVKDQMTKLYNFTDHDGHEFELPICYHYFEDTYTV
jgi:hypothetical protein